MWSVTNYEGQYAFGTSGVLTNAMFELCRAVNERQHALDVAVTQFKDKDGNLASDLELEDFVGMFITGDGNYFRYNCEAIMNWIRLAINNGWFMEAPSVTSQLWTAASMEADVGLGSSWMTYQSPRYLENVCDYLFYQRCQEALDRMKYVAARNFYNRTRSMTIVGSESDTGYPDFATAWSNRGDFPYASPSTGWFTELRIGGFVAAFPATGGQVITETYLSAGYNKDEYALPSQPFGDGQVEIVSPGTHTLSGAIVESYANVSRTRRILGPTGAHVSFGNFLVDGEDVPFPTSSLPVSPVGSNVFGYGYMLRIYSSPSLTDNFYLPVYLYEPSGFSAGTSFGDQAYIHSVEVYVDISAELSDQT